MTRTSAQANLYRAGAIVGLGAALTCSGLAQYQIAEALTPPGTETIELTESVARFPEFLSMAAEEMSSHEPISDKPTFIPLLELGGVGLFGCLAGASYRRARALSPKRYR
jgi:hypothetical protein